MYAFTVLVLLLQFFLNLAFCLVDTDVCIICTCAFFDCQVDFDVDNVQHCELVNFYGV